MSNCIIKGKAFWEFDGSGTKHLYFIVSEPDIDDKVLAVNITDANNLPAKHDKSCQILPQKHPAIIKILSCFTSKQKN